MHKTTFWKVSVLAVLVTALGAGCTAEQDPLDASDEGAEDESSEEALTSGGEVAAAEATMSRAGVGDASGDDEPGAQDKSGKKGVTVCKNGRTVAYMQAKVTKYCKSGNANGNDTTLACSGGLTCSEISRRANATAWCLEARINIVKQCFDGKPDAAHAERLRYHSRRLSNCVNLEQAALATGLCKPAGPRSPYPG